MPEVPRYVQTEHYPQIAVRVLAGVHQAAESNTYQSVKLIYRHS